MCIRDRRDAHVFHRVMRIDVQVALGLDVEVDQAVARDLVDVYKRQAPIFPNDRKNVREERHTPHHRGRCSVLEPFVTQLGYCLLYTSRCV